MTLESTHRLYTQLLIGLFGCFAVVGASAMDKPEIFVQIGHAQGIYAIAAIERDPGRIRGSPSMRAARV